MRVFHRSRVFPLVPQVPLVPRFRDADYSADYLIAKASSLLASKVIIYLNSFSRHCQSKCGNKSTGITGKNSLHSTDRFLSVLLTSVRCLGNTLKAHCVCLHAPYDYIRWE
jgi:hypothetical protein